MLRARQTAAPTSSAKVFSVSSSEGDHSHSRRQLSKPMKPHQRPSAKMGTAAVDLRPPRSKNRRTVASKSWVWPTIASPRASLGTQDLRPAPAMERPSAWSNSAGVGVPLALHR